MFQPSAYSNYGDGSLEPVAAPAAGGGVDVGQYVNIGVSAVRSLLGLDSGDRESAAAVQAKIEVAEKKRANNAFPGAWYYDDQIIKLQHKLVAAQEIAAEEAREAAITEARNIGYTVLVFMGGAVALGLAVNQFQKARLSGAEIRRLEAAG